MHCSTINEGFTKLHFSTLEHLTSTLEEIFKDPLRWIMAWLWLLPDQAPEMTPSQTSFRWIFLLQPGRLQSDSGYWVEPTSIRHQFKGKQDSQSTSCNWNQETANKWLLFNTQNIDPRTHGGTNECSVKLERKENKIFFTFDICSNQKINKKRTQKKNSLLLSFATLPVFARWEWFWNYWQLNNSMGTQSALRRESTLTFAQKLMHSNSSRSSKSEKTIFHNGSQPTWNPRRMRLKMYCLITHNTSEMNG